MSIFYSKPYPVFGAVAAGDPPTSWEYLASYISNATWTAPDTAWYKLFVWGGSANGVAGGTSSSSASGTFSGGNGGRGGNTGGFSAHQVWLKKNDTIPISFSSGIATVGVSGSDLYIRCTAGGNTSSNPGSATGGNIANLSGAVGGNGGVGAQRYYSSGRPWLRRARTSGSQGGNSGANGGSVYGPSTASPQLEVDYATGGSGGGGARAVGQSYASNYINSMSSYKGGNGGKELSYRPDINGTAGSSVPAIVASSSIKVTGAGSGGGGGTWVSDTVLGTGGSGGNGQGACVIIERGA